MNLQENPKFETLAGRMPDLADIMAGFIPLNLSQLFIDTALPCSIYFPSLSQKQKTIKLSELLSKGELYVNETNRALRNHGIKKIYIQQKDEREFLYYFHSQLQKIMRSRNISPDKKTKILYFNAEAVIEKVFRESPNPVNITIGKQLIDNFTQLVTTGSITAKSLMSLFSRDYYTFNHCVQVAMLGMLFGKHIGWGELSIASYGLCALFHDVGKNSIDETILNKPGKLENKEYEVIKKHSFLGYEQLKSSYLLTRHQLLCILHHHESADGTGYPDGLASKAIPLYARVLHIVDVFDALVSERVYKRAMTHEEALNLMTGQMRSSFDDTLLHAFSDFVHNYYIQCKTTEIQ